MGSEGLRAERVCSRKASQNGQHLSPPLRMCRISPGGEWDRVLPEGLQAAAQGHKEKNVCVLLWGWGGEGNIQSSEEGRGQVIKGPNA